MLRLKCIPDPELSWYTKIAGAKLQPMRGRLEAMMEDIAIRYAEYVLLQHNLQGIAPSVLEGESKSDCEHCYDVETQPLSDLKKRIINCQEGFGRSVCQYCGIGEARTFDHYLPKTVFPEFSVLCKNLIPACFDCNNKKSSYWIRDGSRLFYNYYFDVEVRTRYLHANVRLDTDLKCGHIDFELRRPSEMPEDLFGLIGRHFDRLSLLPRYQSLAIPEWSELIESARARVGHNTQSVLRDLLATADTLESHRGVNHWKPVLIRGAIESIRQVLQRTAP